jgi:NAD(P)H-dependent FMN reductase
MKFTIVSGSTRKVSQSFKVATYVKHMLEKIGQQAFLLNLAEASIKCSLDILFEYAKAFVGIRNSEAVKNYPFPYGM